MKNLFILLNFLIFVNGNEIRNATQRIINGEDSSGFPWLVAIWTRDGNKTSNREKIL